MSGPWIRDYLVDVAETYGTQLYDAPRSSLPSGKKKVQLVDVRPFIIILTNLDGLPSSSLIKKIVTFGHGYPTRITECPSASLKMLQACSRGQSEAMALTLWPISTPVTVYTNATSSTVVSPS